MLKPIVFSKAFSSMALVFGNTGTCAPILKVISFSSAKEADLTNKRIIIMFFFINIFYIFRVIS